MANYERAPGPRQMRSRYWLGVSPIQLRKARVKLAGLRYPRRVAMSSTLRSECSSILTASRLRASLASCAKEVPSALSLRARLRLDR